MKMNELISEFTIAMSNEEEEVLNKLSYPLPLHSFHEREQFIIESLIRKALVSRVRNDNMVLVVANELN
jgi:hypothetical protein|tara:strand:- start:1440 stop:1646 length:207 start_codon:yes stop_codon:yes gene_type:complete